MSRRKLPSSKYATDSGARANAFLNSYDSDLVQSLYKKQALGYITVTGDGVRLQKANSAREVRLIVKEEDADPGDASVLSKARSAAATMPPVSGEGSPLAYVLLWLSEVGRNRELRESASVEAGGAMLVEVEVDIEEVNVVFTKVA